MTRPRGVPGGTIVLDGEGSPGPYYAIAGQSRAPENRTHGICVDNFRKLRDHEHSIDAMRTATALAAPGPVTVLTSGESVTIINI